SLNFFCYYGAFECGNLRATAKVKTRAPWIPPGKTSLRESGYKWEGPTHRLEITPLDGEKLHSTLHLSDLSTEEEDAVHEKMNQYEKKIRSLMNEVGTLKNEVKEELNESKRLIEEKEMELAGVTKELAITEQRNQMLRRNIEMMTDESDISCSERKRLHQEKDMLLTKLVEVEMDGAAVSKQVAALSSTICKLRNEKSVSASEANVLARQQGLLLQKLNTFSASNRLVQKMLKEQHCQQVRVYLMIVFYVVSQRLSMKLHESEKEIEHLLSQCESTARASTEQFKTVETTRAHLQGQLRNKEAENNRMAIQIKNFERTIAHQKGEMDYLMEQLRLFQTKGDRDKEALKKATKAQKQRAERSEDTAEHLSVQLFEKVLADALSSVESWKCHHNKLAKERNQLEKETSLLNKRITDLMDQLQHVEDKTRAEREALMTRLHAMTSESTSIRLENERLKASMCAVEEKLTFAQAEMQQLKLSVKRYEGLVDSYKAQVMKTRLEADDFCMKLVMAEKENKMLKEDVNKEIELVRRQMQSRLTDLEPVPELLKLTEHKLQDCQEQLIMYERKTAEQSASICDLRMKIEQQGDKESTAREKWQCMQEENRHLQLKLDALARKLDDGEAQNRELIQVVAKREETIHQNQHRLEEKSRECSSLARQLETALDEARCQVDQTRDRALSKERATQSKILDLETQLSRTKTELTQLGRSKEDAERRCQSRLQDLKDRLEQSESTNRSMQNYVQFLKSSYANVFGDTVLTSSPVCPRSPL
uniref:Outer dense fiber protein 2 n=1 Tax=Callorhinchus milii TaxID=7868 RepID=A0A4W3JG62_CALMI